MGGYPLGASETYVFYKEFNKKSIIWGKVFFFNFQWSAVVDSIMAYHVETIWNRQNPWDAIRFQLEKVNAKKIGFPDGRLIHQSVY